ncbi:hypothetical protein [Sorangium cellulosum]|uniref:Uncharacterized protein n=1 Tax=Sorangium cellulosum TaxID=56 RepID=A0A150Q8S0_SORCE|nr:hypothetical protein [Sorangium cellulosum]KYF64351.1 hypothetical protein BE15_07505 [Sorangium cellulosum]
MRHWILGAIGAALIAATWGCGSGNGDGGAATGGGGAAAGGGGATGGGGTGSQAAACTLAAQGLEVSSGDGATPSIAWAGAGFAVAWQQRGADEGDIHLAVLDAEGNRLREEVIEGGPGISSHPSVHRVGQGLLILWQDRDATGSVVRGRRATLAGVAEGAAFDLVKSGAAESWPIAAASRDRVLLAWMDAGGSQLGALDSGALASSTPLDQAQFPAVATDGERTALAWTQGDTLLFARVGQGSEPLDPIAHQGVAAKVTRVALGGDDAFLAWEDTRDGAEQIRALRISAQNEASREVVVSRGEGSANWPALAWTGRSLAVAYYQFRERAPAVFVTLLSPDLTPTGVELTVSGDAPARYPALAWTGQELGIAYAEKDRGIRLSRATCR